ncbi:MAG: hypothetical protein JOZ52_06890 [Acidobacteria bacterium]|nr:hypothetical protein [Acidobacteriota bacterium]
MKRFSASLIALLILTCGLLSAAAFAQAKKKTTPAASKTTVKTTNDPLAVLPESDGVVSIDAQRLLNDMLPSVFADNPTKLAEINARIDQTKTRTGIDVRAFERVAVGMRFVNTAPDKLAVESVALARGKFNAQEMINAALLATKDKYKYTEQKYGGKTLYVFNADELFGKGELPQATIDAETRKSGGKAAQVADDLLQKIMNFKGEVAVTALDANTLAIGQPARVRAAIDAGKGRGRVAESLTQLATRTPDAVVGFGANSPANVSKYFGLDATDDIAKTIDTIRQVYGSVTSAGGGFEMQAFARTDNQAQAQEVYNTLAGFKDLGGFFVANLSGDKGKLAKSALDNLKITKEANEVQLRLALAQADVAMLVRVLDKKN